MKYDLGQVVGLELYENDIVVVREGKAPNTNGENRGEIVEFSKASRRRLAFVASNTTVHFRTMITLTYPKVFPCDGKRVKAHLRQFLTWLKKDTTGCAYLWFLEFQRRGAPHVHILIDWKGKRGTDALRCFRFRTSLKWYGIVGSEDNKHLQAGTRVETLRKPDGARRYAVKYAAKMRQKAVPPLYRNVGRFWGCTRGVVPDKPELIECTDDDIRALIDDWEYKPDAERPLYRVLYNQADRLRAHLAAKLDKGGESCYTGSQSQQRDAGN